MPEYYEVIKKLMDLPIVKRKLESKYSAGCSSLEESVTDVLLIFRNCAKFSQADTEIEAAGKNLEKYFEEQLRGLCPDRTFPEVKAEGAGPVTPPTADEDSPTAKRPRRALESQVTCSPAPTGEDAGK
ncbi:hypothetical protein MATL_G00245530 [Megalops atlanticus]|uniref:Bromo domain-containing protein n=1 Tax=Megalops atlanticus TaxID=7932 RepID=A0A9D3SWM6_MEGAT|nr:hypothetical protein MATL_G00245530 [Megalops atlanticus]